jgi:high-affinity Fe2+/Pb2+ permease
MELLVSVIVLIICAIAIYLTYQKVNTTTPQGWVMLAILVAAAIVAIVVLLALVGVNLLHL